MAEKKAVLAKCPWECCVLQGAGPRQASYILDWSFRWVDLTETAKLMLRVQREGFQLSGILNGMLAN